MSKEAIVSLAVLKVNWEREGKSFTDNFVPLVAECLRTSTQPVVSLPEVQAKVFVDFGLRVPGPALSIVLGRLERRGYLRREHRAYVPNRSKLQVLKLEETRSRVLKHHEETLARLIEFCVDRYEIQWTEQDAEDALLLYLKEHDLDILKATTEGTPIPPLGRSVKNGLFIVNSFTRHVSEKDPESFAYLETVVKGHMLANALVFPDVSAVTRRFRRTRVYLDTRFVINALGYNGDYRRAAAQDLLNLLYE